MRLLISSPMAYSWLASQDGRTSLIRLFRLESQVNENETDSFMAQYAAHIVLLFRLCDDREGELS